jgi:hypothetical protein
MGQKHGSRMLQRAIALPALVFMTAAVAVPAAMAQDRPVGVAQEKTFKQVHINADGTLTAKTSLRCDLGWESSDFSFFVTQGDASTSGFIEPGIPCDGKWHRVQYQVPTGLGTFHKGKAQFSGQFLVFNLDSGDPSASHEQKTVHLGG